VGEEVMKKTSSQIADDVLYKVAGIREFVRFLGTGRATAHHGTSAAIAKGIRNQGLIPGKSRGIVDVFKEMGLADPTKGKNLSFLSRSSKGAKNYATQQGFIEAAGQSPVQIGTEVGKDFAARTEAPSIKYVWDTLKQRVPQLYKGVKGGRESARKGMLEASYPARHFKPQKNPEIGVATQKFKDLGEQLTGAIDTSPTAKKIIEKGYQGAGRLQGELSFGNTFGLPPGSGGAALPSKYIRGAQDYQHVGLPEVKEHLRHSMGNPKETVVEALRNLTGYQF
jgi:hypothetical protein